MPNIKTKFLDKKDIAEGTVAFYFEKPRGFQYIAGQFIDVTLPGGDGPQVHAFSIASAPHEDQLMIATRMRDSSYKRVLGSLTIGSEIELSEPIGDFTLHNNQTRGAVFLIGGIGVTPVRSILVDASHRQLPHKLFLFYSNRRPADTPFLSELIELEKQSTNFKLMATMTDSDKSATSWPGERGYITADMIKKYLADTNAVIWYLAGPAMMVKAMRDILTAMNIDRDYIKTEEFSGY